ncbi:hypothetical protein B0T13DRAFT_450274 [Neurospora crassa]|nr:hypothetical protein B0T13DRAFT_450274 [Neurospora crassa]
MQLTTKILILFGITAAAVASPAMAAYTGPCSVTQCGASGVACPRGYLCVPWPSFDPALREGSERRRVQVFTGPKTKTKDHRQHQHQQGISLDKLLQDHALTELCSVCSSFPSDNTPLRTPDELGLEGQKSSCGEGRLRDHTRSSSSGPQDGTMLPAHASSRHPPRLARPGHRTKPFSASHDATTVPSVFTISRVQVGPFWVHTSLCCWGEPSNSL